MPAGHRPVVSRAAVAYGGRAIGVLLSGTLDDGTQGLAAIKRCHGVAMVQDPKDADYPEMPATALRHVQIDHCLALADIGPTLARLVREPVATNEPVPNDLEFEAAMAEWDPEALEGRARPGKPSPFVCPDCRGDLWEIHEKGEPVHYRCRTGHAWSPMSLRAGQAQMLDEALNEAYRALKESEHFDKRLARRAHGHASEGSTYYAEQAKIKARSAAVLREMLMDLRADQTEKPKRKAE